MVGHRAAERAWRGLRPRRHAEPNAAHLAARLSPLVASIGMEPVDQTRSASPGEEAASGSSGTSGEGHEEGAREALFTPDGDGFLPGELARGPWSPEALHGGPVAALAVRAAERCEPEGGLQLVRLTLELIRPVPLSRLSVVARLVRPGRRVQLVDVIIEAGGVAVALARGLRMRVAPPPGAQAAAVPSTDERRPPSPEHGVVVDPLRADYRAFHNGAMEIRFVDGRFDVPGPATAWFRLRYPVVRGEEPSPWQRAAAAADFGNGISAQFPFGSAMFINPDLTIELVRPPDGPWVGLEARTRFGSPGIGWAESALWDADGRIGRSMQTLLVE